MKVNGVRRQTASKRPGSNKLEHSEPEEVLNSIDKEEDIIRCINCKIADCDGNCPPTRYVSDMPKSFSDDVNDGLSIRELQAKYQTSKKKIENWRRALRASQKERVI